MTRPLVEFVTRSVSRQGGGVAAVVLQSGLDLMRQGEVSVRVVTTWDGDFDEATAAELPIEAFRFFGPDNFRLSPGLFWRVLTSQADVMHLHGLWSFSGLAVLAWHLRTGRPYIVSPHGMLEPWILRRSRRLKAAVSGLYQGLLLEFAAVFQVLTEKEAGDVRAVVPTGHCVVIPNAVPIVAQDDGPPDWQDLIMAGRRVYLYLGRIHDKKGWRELCAAWRWLCSSDDDFADRSQLVFCGWVDDAPDFAAVMDLLSREFGNAVFAGPQYGEDKARSLQAADIVVLPSKSEGLPLVVLESWGHGKPVLMTEACNLPEGFECCAGMRIREDAAAIAAGLKRASLWDAEQMCRMGEAGRNLILRDFSPTTTMARTTALLLSAVAERRGGR